MTTTSVRQLAAARGISPLFFSSNHFLQMPSSTLAMQKVRPVAQANSSGKLSFALPQWLSGTLTRFPLRGGIPLFPVAEVEEMTEI